MQKSIPKFEKYDTIDVEKKLKLFSDLYLPIELIKKTHYELKNREITYQIEEAKELGIQKCIDNLENEVEINNNLLNKYININKTNEYVDVEVIYEIQEDIGAKEKIVF